jgi:hypothetical protein
MNEKSKALIEHAIDDLDIAQDYNMDDQSYMEISRAIHILEKVLKLNNVSYKQAR